MLYSFQLNEQIISGIEQIISRIEDLEKKEEIF